MRNSISSKAIRGAAVAALTGALALGAASGASAQSRSGLAPVVGCDAPGNKQAGGAVIGALLGGVLGSNLAKNDRGTGTAVGAVLGAGVGSTVGCKMQRADQDQATYGYDNQYSARPTTYTARGYRLSSDVRAASFQRDGQVYVAGANLNLRAAPTTSSARVASLRAGERFQALARVRGTDWILVGQNGVGVGYVHGAYVEPEGYSRYATRY